MTDSCKLRTLFISCHYSYKIVTAHILQKLHFRKHQPRYFYPSYVPTPGTTVQGSTYSQSWFLIETIFHFHSSGWKLGGSQGHGEMWTASFYCLLYTLYLLTYRALVTGHFNTPLSQLARWDLQTVPRLGAFQITETFPLIPSHFTHRNSNSVP